MGESRGRSPPPGEGPFTFTTQEYEHASAAISSDEMAIPPHLSVLKTKAESRAQSETIQCWTVELPVKAANNILILCKESIPDQDSIDLQHLRRFAKSTALPVHLQPPGSRSNSASASRPPSSNGSTNGASANGSTKSKSRSRSRMRRRRNNSAASTLHLLVCPITLITSDDLTALLSTQAPFNEEGTTPKIREVTVPLLSPISIEQAQQWTAQYWPTLYRKTNPFGPHPTIVLRAEEELMANKSVGKFIDMAYHAAAETKKESLGIGAGCVVVERRDGKEELVVAIAGDARCCGASSTGTNHEPQTAAGNIAAHAVLRAIGMVARKRVRVASPKPTAADGTSGDVKPSKLLVTPVEHKKNAPESVSASLLDYPLTPREKGVFEQDNLTPNGYLCVDLEIYLTHEPCLMCSMAIVHSRFGRCVFSQRMPATGGMSANSDLGYGLFWRSELNWKLLCWEWTDAKKEERQKTIGMLRADTQV